MNSNLWQQAYKRLFSIYGKNPPEQCLRRLKEEKQALENTDAIEVFAVLGKIREEAKRQNTMIIVTGTTASCFTAWLMGGTAVNPLPPHYLCSNCGKSEFVPDVRDGFDLPTKKCTCGTTLSREGHNIPYQGFADSAQTGIQAFVYVSTSFRPFAVSIAKEFYRDSALFVPVKKNFSEPVSWEEYIVCPEPGHYPPLSEDGVWDTNGLEYMLWYEDEITFVFDISEQLDYLDTLRETTQMTLPEPEDLLREPVLNVFYKEVCYGAPFITEKLPENTPITCDVLMRIDGLSRSIGAWEGNGVDLIRYRIADFCDIPAFREDVWNTLEDILAKNNYDHSTASLRVMKRVRKGRYHDWKEREEMENILLDFGLPGWYLLGLTKINYLFPKAHSVEQLLADLACAWYRIRFPKAFSCCMDLYKSSWDRRWEVSPFKFVDESSFNQF